MVDFGKLMALSEATTGFSGGNMVDEMPNYTLDEAVTYLPMMIMESQIEQHIDIGHQNEAIVEAVVESVKTGDNSNFASINEGVLSTIKEKAVKIFEKLKNVISSIIVKIKAFIATRKNKGEDLIKKYESKIDPAKLTKDLTFKGYTFDKDVKMPSGDIDSVIGSAYPYFKDGFVDADKAKNMKEKVKAIDSGSHPERMRKIASTLTGITLTKTDSNGGWQDELTKALYGVNDDGEEGKVVMHYGEKCFQINKIKEMLTRHDKMNALMNAYDKLLKNVNIQMNNVQNLIDHNSEDDKEAAAYYNAYMMLYQDAMTAASTVNATVKGYLDTQWKQASQMWLTLAQAGKKKEEKPEKEEEKPEENNDAPEKKEKKGLFGKKNTKEGE